MMKRISFLLLITLLLTSCTSEENTVIENSPTVEEIVETTSIFIKLIEFTSQAPVVNKQVILNGLNDDTYVETFSDKNGHILFEDIAVGKEVEVNIGTGLTKESLSFTVEKEKGEILIETHSQQRTIAVPVVLQKPVLPTGCEITSLTAIFNYYGETITKEEMAEKHLNKVPLRYENGKRIGPNPQEAFPGEPTDPKGIYIFPEGIIDSIHSYSEANGKDYTAVNLTGASIEEIEDMVKEGLPILTWITRDLGTPIIRGSYWMDGTNEYHHIIQNEHAVVLTRVTEDTVTIMDPLQGNVTHDKIKFFKSFESLGNMAVTLY
ncbi:C39 family peptidase [Solibacillus isronensis]|uniref:C39 family peptidase n=2 Tax=Caryophanaceae TaxID=186818 RepID=UPI0009A71E9B